MQHEVVLAWLAALFGLMAVTLVVAAVLVNWAVLVVALPLAGMAALLWYHASGRLTERMRSQARRRSRGRGRQRARGQRRRRAPGQPGPGPAGAGGGPFGGGPRGANGVGGAGRRSAGREDLGPPDDEMSHSAALAVLDLEPGAGDEAVRAAYRRKVKQTHPDRGGDRETFIEVTEAYEALGGGS